MIILVSYFYVTGTLYLELMTIYHIWIGYINYGKSSTELLERLSPDGIHVSISISLSSLFVALLVYKKNIYKIEQI